MGHGVDETVLEKVQTLELLKTLRYFKHVQRTKGTTSKGLRRSMRTPPH